MKRFLPYLLLSLLPVFGFAQADSVSIGAGYTSQAFYSFTQGVVKTSTSDWDLAFGTGGFDVAIRSNDGHAVKIYLYPNGDTAAWNTIDTNGLQNWSYRHNFEHDWQVTAFSDTAKSHPDYGWGVYNGTTHNVVGDSIYIIETKSGEFKKFRVDGMMAMTGSFEVTYADLDGSNEKSVSISKTAHNDKNFVYLSIEHDSVMDLEPNADEWDIVFSKYSAAHPQGGFYNVTGVQTNYHRTSAEARGVDLNNVDWQNQTFVEEIGTVGWDWKTFNMQTFEYDMVDSLTYFVADTNDNVWQMTFTGFAYQTGTFYFNKERVNGVSSVEDGFVTASFNAFPNPAVDFITVELNEGFDASTEVSVFSLTGNRVWSQTVNTLDNAQVIIPVSNWQKGMYIIRVGVGSEARIQNVIVQ